MRYSLIFKRNILTDYDIIQIHAKLEKNNVGFRKLLGTALKNLITNEIVYSPSQDFETIKKIMSNLEQYINDDKFSAFDPLVKMVIIHLQFESIYPF
jgi:Fic family protein